MNREVFLFTKTNIYSIMKPSYQAEKEGNAHALWPKSVLSGIKSGFGLACMPVIGNLACVWNECLRLAKEHEKIELSMGIHHGKKGKPIVVYASHLPNGTIKEIECCFDQGLYLAVTYEDGQKAKAYKPGSSVGVDLGEVHTIGAFCENGQALLITGRKIRSLHRLRNKKLAEILRRQSKCVKKDRADGKRMSGRNDTCCRNQKYSCGMRSIKRPNSLSIGV